MTVSRPSTTGVAIRVFLVDGDPQGLRLVERMGWTGVCLAFARADYSTVRLRPEVKRTGVYVLYGPNPDGQRAAKAYVGESDVILKRLDDHQNKKDFWTHGYLLTTTDNSLNKAQVRYLESRLLELARAADVCELDNGTEPDVTWLSEADQAAMESYLDYSLDLLSLVGVEIFDLIDEEPSPVSVVSLPVDNAPDVEVVFTPTVDEKLLFLKVGPVDAQARNESRGFVVREGSIARRQQLKMTSTYKELRDQLIREGAFEEIDDERLRVTRPLVFNAPSAAASVLSASSLNGRDYWKDSTGVTLKVLQQRSTQSPADAESES